MRPAGTRILRRILLAVVVVVGVAVAWTLRRPTPPDEPDASASGTPAEGTTIGDLAFFQFDEGEQRVQVKARAGVGEEGGEMHLEGVEVTFPYVARGEESTATITSDECFYDADRQRARFRGNVVAVTRDGFELRSESLDYLGDEMRVRTDQEVEFGRGSTTGRARGARYNMATEEIALKSDVWLRFEDPERPPTEIEAARAVADQRTRLIRFQGGVRMTSGNRVLTSQRLRVLLDGNLERIEHAAAIENADLRTSGGGELGSATLPPSGSRRLRCRRLNVAFRRGVGTLRQALAVNGASLELDSAPGEPPERRTITGHSILFAFDGRERLRAVVARAGGPRVNPKGTPVVLTAEPLPAGSGIRREVECGRFRANLDPVSGEIKGTRFWEAVVFREPGRTARADQASFNEKGGLLRLRGGPPRIRDDGDGSELQAQEIDLATGSGRVTAVGGVRHQIRRGGDTTGTGMLTGSEPAVLVCQKFEYDSARKKAWYRENALLRSGDDEIRAPLIVLEDPAPGRRRLNASGGVVSTLHPRPADGAEEPAAVEARSQEMVYEEESSRVVYTGSVDIRQGDIVTLSPRAVVTLEEDGSQVETIVAGQPVEVRQGVRRATGTTGTYTPRTETMVLEGDEVTLQDVDRKVRGRILTFQVGEDRIRVDGEEETRTEAIFHKRDAPRP